MSTALSAAEPQPPRGWFSPLTFPPLALLTLAVAICMGWVLAFAFRSGWYYAFVTPGGLALPVVGAVFLAVGWGHCRSKTVAVLLGVAAGLVLMVAYFYFDMRERFGPAVEGQVELLPRYIAWRMATDVEIDPGGRPQPTPQFLNWMFLALDTLIVIVIPAGAAAVRAGRGYCGRCRRWLRQQLAYAPPGSAKRLAELWQAGTIEEFPPLTAYEASPGAACSLFRLEFCPGPTDRRSSAMRSQPATRLGEESGFGDVCPLLLTAQEIVANKVNGTDVAVATPTAIKHTPLSREQLRTLAARIPGFEVTNSAGGSGTALPEVRSGRLLVEPVSTGTRLATDSKWFQAACFLMSLLPIAALLGGAGLVGWACYAEFWNAAGFWPWLAVAGGALLAVFGAVVCWANVDYLNFAYGRRVRREILRSRADAVVDPDDRAAVYVHIVPRANWASLMSDHASDGGWVRVDADAGELLFEGIHSRCRLPADRIAGCRVEPINPLAGRATIYVTVVRADLADRLGDTENLMFELPLLPRPVRFGRTRRQFRLDAAEALEDAVEAL